MTSRTAGPGQPRFFRDATAFRVWLQKNAATQRELIVGFYKVGSGKQSITWPESVDEALCFGWIDGVRKRINEEAYQIRFTPRAAKSIWSAVNIGRVKELVAEKRMTAAGLAAFARRLERRSRVYAYEQGGASQLNDTERSRFMRHRAAWKFWESMPPGYQKTMLHWVTSAKRPETRERRLDKLINACSNGMRLLP